MFKTQPGSKQLGDCVALKLARTSGDQAVVIMLARALNVSLDAHYVLVTIMHAGHLSGEPRSVVHSIARPVTVDQAQRVGCRGEVFRRGAWWELRWTCECKFESQGLSRVLTFAVAFTGTGKPCS